MSKGFIIDIEGTDGSGKATQAAILTQKLLSHYPHVMKISYPRYGNPFAKGIETILNKKLTDDLTKIDPYLMAVCFAADRAASLHEIWYDIYKTGGIIVADRYCASNIIHQTPRIKPEDRAKFIKWLHDLEHVKLKLPEPDITVYLDVDETTSANILQERINNNRQNKEGVQNDILEADIAYQNKCKHDGRTLAKQLDWEIIQCGQNGKIRTPRDIASEIWDAVTRCLNTRK